jgi:hypothetical protein
VTETRNNNAPLFITVLCACLGLLTAGAAAAHARQAPYEMAHRYGASAIHLRLAASAASSLQVLHVDERLLPDVAAESQGRTKAVLLRKSEAHAELNQVLTITNLARASLSEPSAKPPQACPSRDEE